MPHVTFIHGIGNKLPPAALSRDWLGTLAQYGLDLDAQGVSSSLVYWADLLYPAPLVSEAGYESAAEPGDAGVPDIGMGWMAQADGAEAAFVARLAAAIGFRDLAGGETAPPTPAVPAHATVGPAGAGAAAGAADAAAGGFERVPLPPWLKRRLMEILLRDVHHYLFNTAFSPRPGETYRIRDVIRARVCAALTAGAAAGRPHVLVTHSMGTVIGYDCLKRVPACPPVDALMTIGSPLGLDEIQDGLTPGWSRPDGFPGERLRGRWVNVYDSLDPVAGFDPDLANDYRRRGLPVVEDIREENWGRWRHSISKYFAGQRLRARLADLLELSSTR